MYSNRNKCDGHMRKKKIWICPLSCYRSRLDDTILGRCGKPCFLTEEGGAANPILRRARSIV